MSVLLFENQSSWTFQRHYDNPHFQFSDRCKTPSYTIGKLLNSSLFWKKGLRPYWECVLIGEFKVYLLYQLAQLICQYSYYWPLSVEHSTRNIPRLPIGILLQAKVDGPSFHGVLALLLRSTMKMTHDQLLSCWLQCQTSEREQEQRKKKRNMYKP